MTCRVAIFEDDPVYRASLELLLATLPRFTLAGSYGSPSEPIDELAQGAAATFDLALMDLEMPALDGITATRRLKALVPGVKVVVLTAFDEPPRILQAICAGADGYLVKRATHDELAAQLHEVLDGGAPLTARVARSVLELLRDRVVARARPALSPRERAVLAGFVEGKRRAQIAAELGVALADVRADVRALYDKLQVTSVAAAVAVALREQLVGGAAGDGAPTAPARRAPAAGPVRAATGDRYQLLERLGEGAMGVVWSAHDRVLDREVALKVLHDRYLGAVHQERLAAEARAMARLSHRNVVAVHDVGERDGRAFITMELVRGVDLARWLARPRSWREIARVFRAAAAGLAAAHAAGIVHRDVKPTNILVGDAGVVKVADFGVAQASAADADDSAGSPAYMAPEQRARMSGLDGDAAARRPVDGRADQFALCVALFEALHGHRPWRDVAREALPAAIERGPPPPTREVPDWLHAAVARGLAFDPERRFPSMRELGAALRGPRRWPWSR